MKKWLVVGLVALSLAKASPLDIKQYFRHEVGPKADWVSSAYYEEMDRKLSAYHSIKDVEDVKIALTKAPFYLRADINNMLFSLKHIEEARIKLTLINANTLQYYRADEDVHIMYYDKNKINYLKMPNIGGCYPKNESTVFIDWKHPKAAYFLGASIIENAFKGLVPAKNFTSALLEHLGNAYRKLHATTLAKLLPNTNTSVTTKIVIKFPKPDKVLKELEKRLRKRPIPPTRLKSLLNARYFSVVSPSSKKSIETTNRKRYLEYIELEYRTGVLSKNKTKQILISEGYTTQEINSILSKEKFKAASPTPQSSRRIELF